MDSEERHELKENELKNWMQYGFPVWIKQNGSYILLAVALAVLGYQIWNYYQSKQRAMLQTAWSELYQAERPETENRPIKLEGIINEYDYKPVRAMALRALGNAYLDIIASGQTDESSTAIAFDRDDALNRAEAAYQRILSEFPDQTLAVGAAKLGLATIAEDRGDWDSAKKQYEALTDKASPFAGTAVALDATAKLVDLDKRKNAPHLAAAVAPASTSTGPASMPLNMPFGPELPMGPESMPATRGSVTTFPASGAMSAPAMMPATGPATAPK